MSFPAFLAAATDPLVVRHGSVAAVYLHLASRLDFREFRRVRASRVAVDLGVRPETVGLALKVLRDGGYIERGERVMDVFTYRLAYSLPSENASTR